MRSDAHIPKKGEIVNDREFLGDIEYRYISGHKRNYLKMKCTLCGNESYVESKQAYKAYCKCTQPNRVLVKHGFRKKGTRNRFYEIFFGIKDRCYNNNNSYYNIYGGRGIACERNTFEEFASDMYDSYKEHIEKYGEKNTSIDRIDTNGNYCKENCRWATIDEQNYNKRNTVKVEIDGVEYNGKILSELLGISRGTAHDRIIKFLSGKISKDKLFFPCKHKPSRLEVNIDGVIYNVKNIQNITFLSPREARRRLRLYIDGKIAKEQLFKINKNVQI